MTTKLRCICIFLGGGGGSGCYKNYIYFCELTEEIGHDKESMAI